MPPESSAHDAPSIGWKAYTAHGGTKHVERVGLSHREKKLTPLSFWALKLSFALEGSSLSHSITLLWGTKYRTLDDEHSHPANWKLLHCTGCCLQWTAARVDHAPSIKDFSATVDRDRSDCAALTAAPRAS